MADHFDPTATVSVDVNGKVTVKIFSANFAQAIKSLSFANGESFVKSNVSADQQKADWTAVAPGLTSDYKLTMMINFGFGNQAEVAYLNLKVSDKLNAAVAAGKSVAADQQQVAKLNDQVQTLTKAVKQANTNLQAFDDAQAALKQAQANLATVKQTVENGPAAVAAAQKAVTDAQAALEAAQANLADAQAELTAANARLAAAQAALQKALGQLAIAKAAAGVVDDGATSEPTRTAKPTPAPQGTPTLTTAKVQLTTAQPAAAQKASLPQTGNASASALTVLGMALMSLVLVPFKKFAK